MSPKRSKTAPKDPFPDYTKTAKIAVQAALKAGADSADAMVQCGRTTKVKVRKQEVEELTQAGSKAMGIRVLVDGRSSLLYTSDFTPAFLKKLAKDAVELARHSGQDNYAEIPEAKVLKKSWSDLDLFDPSLLDDPVEAKIERARICERSAEEVSKKIKNTQGTGYSEFMGATVLVTSQGFEGRKLGSSTSIHTIPIAMLRGKRQTDYWSAASRHLADLDDPAEVGRIAAERSLSRLGGKVPPTGEVPVVFDPPSAGTLIGHFAQAAYGSMIFRDASFLAGKLGQKLGPEGFDLIDDPLMRRGLGSTPFDGEGLPSKKNSLFAKGVLKRFLTDSYAAKKLKKARTHSASRSYGSKPGVGTSNLYLKAGELSPEEVLAGISKGVYVTSFMGHGVNLVTGDYSRGATGFWIEDGKITHPIQGFTIAGNLLEMLSQIDAIGSDLEFRSSTNAPTLRVASMMVSGT